MFEPAGTSDRNIRLSSSAAGSGWGPSYTIRVEPIHDRERGGFEDGPPGVFAVPDLIEPVIAFRTFRAMGARLRSPYMRVFWDEPTLTVACRRDACPAHTAPHPRCDCGIYADFRPNLDFAQIDFRGVVGVVSLWGTIEVHRKGMRAQHARVEALAVNPTWHRRQKRSVTTIAEELGVDVVGPGTLERAAERYGRRLSAAPPAQLASAAS